MEETGQGNVFTITGVGKTIVCVMGTQVIYICGHYVYVLFLPP